MTNELTQAQVGLFNAAFLPTVETANPSPVQLTNRPTSLTAARCIWAFHTYLASEALEDDMVADHLELQASPELTASR